MVFSEVPFMSELNPEYLKAVKCLGMSHRAMTEELPLIISFRQCWIFCSCTIVQILGDLSSKQVCVERVFYACTC